MPTPASQRPGTSLRTRPADETLAIARVVGARLGVTGCADATAADLLGVPVWFATRPGGLVTRVHAGKGLRSVDAEVGAWMESIEYALADAEIHTPPDQSQPWPLGDLVAQFDPLLSIADLAPCLGPAMPPTRRVCTDRCVDVATGRAYCWPAELLRLHAPPGCETAFTSTTNGLASGSTLQEATLHALLEVLERDCVALDHARPGQRWLHLSTLPQPWAAWSARWATLGVQLRVRWLPNDFGLPCLSATLTDPGNARVPGAMGWGLHPDPAIALARAISEAAQNRLHALQHGPRAGSLPAGHAAANAQPGDQPTVHFADIEGHRCGGVDDTLDDLLALLRRCGMPWVLRRELRAADGDEVLGGLHVVKVSVPGCETALPGPLRVGRRLAQRLLSGG